ncbi:MAG: hypothetical protein HYT31_02290 [Parcubacteria group bacterium]|nr:hypothetical protein [Parcubacteria group bacterium]
MALVQRKISKGKQIRLVAALLLVVGITALVAYYGLFKKPAAYAPPASTAASGSSVQSRIPGQTGYEAARELSESPVFRSLRSFGVWPLSSNPKGNSQPFILQEE